VAAQESQRQLPPSFLDKLAALERTYLKSDDPIRQSGFGGGEVRWRAEREPILGGVPASGDFLDVGCANGYLLQCLIIWGEERGLQLIPHGLDRGAGLIALAKERHLNHASNFHVCNAWDWRPERTYPCVYTLSDCVPQDNLEEYIHRLGTRIVTPGGRLILGAYGSRSRRLPPFDIGGFLASAGYTLAGSAAGGDPPITRFAWIDT
jgi:SAM-dependent methyltransferase